MDECKPLATDMAEHFNAVGQFKTKLAGNNERVKRISAIAPLDKSQSIVRPAIIPSPPHLSTTWYDSLWFEKLGGKSH